MAISIRIAHLYAHFLNIYGDRGNIITMLKRAQWRGIEATVENVGLGEAIDPNSFDFYFIGGGQDKQQQTIADDLALKAESIRQAVNEGAVILSICGGYQLLGHYYRPHEGKELKGISLLDAYTIAGDQRMIGNVVVKRAGGEQLVGFENHSGKTYLGPDAKPLGKVTIGNGNNGEDLLEGAVGGTVYGTYLHGSLLPKNPQFADELLTRALYRRHGKVTLSPLDDQTEAAAHKRALSLLA